MNGVGYEDACARRMPMRVCACARMCVSARQCVCVRMRISASVRQFVLWNDLRAYSYHAFAHIMRVSASARLWIDMRARVP